MNECLTTPQHEKQIGYWVSEKGVMKPVFKLQLTISVRDRNGHWESIRILFTFFAQLHSLDIILSSSYDIMFLKWN